MLITVRRKHFLKVAEVYFAQGYTDTLPNADIVIYVQSSKYSDRSKECNTLHIDLSKDEETLFSELSKNNQNKIHRAINNKGLYFTVRKYPTDEDIRIFTGFYNLFSKSKGIKGCNPVKLNALRDNNALVFTFISDKEDNPLCYHAYITDGIRARCLYSASHFRLIVHNNKRNFIGCANRYLHWMDIRYFKKEGYILYDFGGLTLNKDEEMEGIDKFKMSFGGDIVTEYNLYKPQSFLGRVSLGFLHY